LPADLWGVPIKTDPWFILTITSVISKKIKIGPHLTKLSSNYSRGSVFWNTLYNIKTIINNISPFHRPKCMVTLLMPSPAATESCRHTHGRIRHSRLLGNHSYLRRRRRLCFWFGLFVCLSVCLSVRRITRKLVNGF